MRGDSVAIWDGTSSCCILADAAVGLDGGVLNVVLIDSVYVDYLEVYHPRLLVRAGLIQAHRVISLWLLQRQHQRWSAPAPIEGITRAFDDPSFLFGIMNIALIWADAEASVGRVERDLSATDSL